jgi:long-subunit fatty acid transport protein
MTGLQQDEMLAGMQIIAPKIEFDSSVADAGGKDGGNAGNVAAIPSFFMVKKLSDRVRMGFSLVAPQGGAMNYGDDFVGRYGATKVSLAAIGGSPSIAGLTYHLSNRLMLGVVYRAEMDVNLEGDLNFRSLATPTPPADDIDIDWDNPQTLKAGLRYEFDPGKRVMFSANWEDWSAFSENQLAITGGGLNPAGVLERNFKDTWSAGVAFVDQSNKSSSYSVGFSYDSSPVSNKDRTIDLPFDETYKFSAAYAWKGSKQLDFGLGATLLYFGDGKVDQTAQGVRFKGEFDTNMALFMGGTARYVF